MIQDNVAKIQAEIAESCRQAGRAPAAVTLVAVTKNMDEKQTREILSTGLLNLAENRSDKFLEKKQKLADFPDISWHFIGNLQRRKVKLIISEIDYFHALDNLKLAAEIEKRAVKKLKCFVEVNVSGEEAKQGIPPEDLEDFITALADFEKIEVVGLMTMAPIDADEDLQHEVFGKLRSLKESIEARQLAHAPCHELSMGMTRDFKIAIEEGATFVRIGTALVSEA